MFAKYLARIILQYVPEGSGSWKYDHYFPVAECEEKQGFLTGNLRFRTQGGRGRSRIKQKVF